MLQAHRPLLVQMHLLLSPPGAEIVRPPASSLLRAPGCLSKTGRMHSKALLTGEPCPVWTGPGMAQTGQIPASPSRPIQTDGQAFDTEMSTDLLLVPAAAAAEPDAELPMQLAKAAAAPDVTIAAQSSRPRPAGLQRRLASGPLAQTPPRPRGNAPQPAPVGLGIETLLAELFQKNQAARSAAPAQEQSASPQTPLPQSAPSTDHPDHPDAAQVRVVKCQPANFCQAVIFWDSDVRLLQERTACRPQHEMMTTSAGSQLEARNSQYPLSHLTVCLCSLQLELRLICW